MALLDFWVERVEGTSPNRVAYVWVEVSADLGDSQNIYCYYGNSGASNVSNGENTFLFFDDFNDNAFDTSKWEKYEPSGTDIAEESQQLHEDANTDNCDVTTVSASFPVGTAFRARLKRDDSGTYCNWFLMFTNDSGGTGKRSQDDSYIETIRWANAGNNVILHSTGGSDPTVYNSDVTQGVFYIAEVIRKASDTVKGFLWDDNYSALGNAEDIITANSDSLFVSLYTGGSSGDTKMDYCFVRKYNSPEPAFSSAGNEETGISDYLPGWDYRKQITITGQSGAGTNYQVLLKVGESSGATGFDFHIEGHSALFPSGENDSGDLRFASGEITTSIKDIIGSGIIPFPR